MSEGKSPLVSVSDVFGVGKLASSPAATRLISAIVSGVGELSYPWRLRRNVGAQIEVMKKIDEELPQGLSSEIELDNRANIRLRARDRRHQINRESISGQRQKPFPMRKCRASGRECPHGRRPGTG